MAFAEKLRKATAEHISPKGMMLFLASQRTTEMSALTGSVALRVVSQAEGCGPPHRAVFDGLLSCTYAVAGSTPFGTPRSASSLMMRLIVAREMVKVLAIWLRLCP